MGSVHASVSHSTSSIRAQSLHTGISLSRLVRAGIVAALSCSRDIITQISCLLIRIISDAQTLKFCFGLARLLETLGSDYRSYKNRLFNLSTKMIFCLPIRFEFIAVNFYEIWNKDEII